MGFVMRSSEGVKLSRLCYVALCRFYANCRHLSDLYAAMGCAKEHRYFYACCYPVKRYERVNNNVNKFGVHVTHPEAVDGALVFLKAGFFYKGVIVEKSHVDLNDEALARCYGSLKRQHLKYHLEQAGQACVDFVSSYQQFKEAGLSVVEFMGLGDELKKVANAAYYRHKIKKFNNALNYIMNCLGTLKPERDKRSDS